jgi:hypothetical protein
MNRWGIVPQREGAARAEGSDHRLRQLAIDGISLTASV